MKCPICDNSNLENIVWQKNFFYANSDEKMDLELGICKKCSFVFQTTAYTDSYDKQINEMYKSFDKSANSKFPHKSSDTEKILNYILPSLIGKDNISLLEVGSNRGDLLYYIKEANPKINILGIEPTRFDDLEVPTINSFFKTNLFSSKFDVIVLQHVLEHIKYPKTIMRGIEKVLKDDGLIFIEVPCLDVFLKNYIEDFTLEHVSYFDLFTLDKTLDGLEIIDYRIDAHLMVMLKKGKKHIEQKSDYIELKTGIENFLNKKHSIIQELKNELLTSDKKFIFYGISYYFSILFREIVIDEFLSKVYFFDDNFSGDIEPTYNLKKRGTFDKDTIVIIASPNISVQNKIENKLKVFMGIHLVKPWSTYYQVQ